MLGQDVTSRGPRGRRIGGVAAFRLAAVLAVSVPVLAALAAPTWGSPGWSGWPSRSRPRRSARCWCSASGGGGSPTSARSPGWLVGGLGSAVAVVRTLAGEPATGWGAVLLAQPAAWTVPLAFATMVVGSLLTPGRVPGHARRFMVRLHTPEALDLDRA